MAIDHIWPTTCLREQFYWSTDMLIHLHVHGSFHVPAIELSSCKVNYMAQKYAG